AAYRGLIDDAVLDDLNEDALAGEWAAEIETPDEPRRHLLVAELDGAVAGYARCGPAEGGPAHTAEVYGLYVHPGYWRRGVARALLEVALERLRTDGFERAMLWVAQGNTRARLAYERLGWRAANDGQTSDFHGAVEVRYARSL
ncbi:MAG TPA: GNAT family N-acetyltransferase, partial [Paracoccaceae bacterium]|nr:GNAT family N-acetyltransferase [Paracoccaceae bacterium]